MPESFETTRFRDEVARPLRSAGRLLKRNLLIEGIAFCAALLLLILAAHLIIDLLLVLGTGPRAALLTIIVAFAIYQIRRRVIKPATIHVNVEDVAAILERTYPGLRNTLVSAVAFTEQAAVASDSAEMVATVVEDARSRFAKLRPDAFLDRRRSRGFVLLGLITVALAACTIFFLPDLVATYIARDILLQEASWPSRTHIVLEGITRNKLRWPQGDDLTLVAKSEGEMPRTLRAEIHLPTGATSTRDMAQRGENQFILDYGPLAASMQVRFLVGRFGVDEPTVWYDIEAIERPRIEKTAITITPPKYAAQPPTTLPSGQTAADVLRGSSVSLNATVNKNVTTAILRLSGKRIMDAVRDPDRRLHAEFTPTIGGSYYLDLIDEGGLNDLHPVTYPIRLISDPPPKVRFGLPGAGEIVTAAAILNINAECEDNLALQSVELTYRLAHEGPSPTTQSDVIVQSLSGFERGMSHFTAQQTWPLSALGLKPGDLLTMSLRAFDFQPPFTADDGAKSSPGLSESIPIMLKIVTPEELLTELGRRESEWRREFELVLKSQEQIKKRILAIHDKSAPNGFAPETTAAYGSEETAQRGQSGRLKTVRRQFEQILAELKINQLDNSAVRKRLESGVIQPLARLANTDCFHAADLMADHRRAFDRKLATQVEQAENKLVDDMNSVLANMLKWEGYNEAVSLLRDVIRLQSDVNRQTQSRLEQQVEDILGPKSTTRPENK